MNKYPLLFPLLTFQLQLFASKNSSINKEIIISQLYSSDHSLLLQLSALVSHCIIRINLMSNLDPPALTSKVKGWVCY